MLWKDTNKTIYLGIVKSIVSELLGSDEWGIWRFATMKSEDICEDGAWIETETMSLYVPFCVK